MEREIGCRIFGQRTNAPGSCGIGDDGHCGGWAFVGLCVSLSARARTFSPLPRTRGRGANASRLAQTSRRARSLVCDCAARKSLGIGIRPALHAGYRIDAATDLASLPRERGEYVETTPPAHAGGSHPGGSHHSPTSFLSLGCLANRLHWFVFHFSLLWQRLAGRIVVYALGSTHGGGAGPVGPG